jgi:hypothetical protein
MMTEPIRPEHAERVRDFYRNQGVTKERERIIELIENELSCTCGTPFSHLLNSIKGETK